MRIVHLVNRLDIKGGVQTYLELLVPAVAAEGIESTFVVEQGTGNSFHGAPVRVVPGVQRDGPVLEADARRRLAAALSSERPDVCYVHIALAPDVCRTAAAVAPVVAYAHDYTMVCPGGGRYLHRSQAFCEEGPGLRCFRRAYTERTTNRRPDRLLRAYRRVRAWPSAWRDVSRVLVASPFVADVLAAAGVAGEQLRVVPYPVAPGGGRRREPGTDVVFIGRLVAAKGVDVLLRSLGRLHGARAAIAGDGPERDRLERLAREQGLEDRVTFHGWIDDAQRARLLASARTLVLPSLWDEPFGIVGLEALAAGVPVVASDVGGIPSWLADGEAGLLVPRGDSHALAEALAAVLRDDDLHGRFAEAASDVVARFSIDRHLELLLPELRAAAA